MKLLEKFAISDINIDDASKVKNFLQKEIFTISNSANNEFIDYDIFNRYNFIVSDLIKRKSSSSTEKTVTVAPDRLITPSSVINSFDKLHNFKSTEMTTRTTSTTRRPLMWKPGKTPNSQKWKKQVRQIEKEIILICFFRMVSTSRVQAGLPLATLMRSLRCSSLTLTSPRDSGHTPLVNYLLLTPDQVTIRTLILSECPK